MIFVDAGVLSGDDTLHGGEGVDKIYGGAGQDYLYGDEGEDTLYGGGGEDTLWGGEADDHIHTGTGWDTVFGGEGCDYIYSRDGGDVIWGGDCDPSDPDASHTDQLFWVMGTGADPSNYTVIMDFWHETAMPHNQLCLAPDPQQGIPGSGNCTIELATDVCLTAVDLMSGRDPVGDSPQRTRNSGCKNDGGPLWVTVELADEETDITNAAGGGDAPRTVWGRIYQKASSHRVSSRASRARRYSQVSSFPTESSSDLVECMALQLCTATGG